MFHYFFLSKDDGDDDDDEDDDEDWDLEELLDVAPAAKLPNDVPSVSHLIGQPWEAIDAIELFSDW
jgi:hypothetical protein